MSPPAENGNCEPSPPQNPEVADRALLGGVELDVVEVIDFRQLPTGLKPEVPHGTLLFFAQQAIGRGRQQDPVLIDRHLVPLRR